MGFLHAGLRPLAAPVRWTSPGALRCLPVEGRYLRPLRRAGDGEQPPNALAVSGEDRPRAISSGAAARLGRWTPVPPDLWVTPAGEVICALRRMASPCHAPGTALPRETTPLVVEQRRGRRVEYCAAKTHAGAEGLGIRQRGRRCGRRKRESPVIHGCVWGRSPIGAVALHSSRPNRSFRAKCW